MRRRGGGGGGGGGVEPGYKGALFRLHFLPIPEDPRNKNTRG